jgi:transcription-repair coupling factor (superfamily II helicase)
MVSLADFLSQFDKSRSYSLLAKKGISVGLVLSKITPKIDGQILLLCDTDRRMQEIYEDLKFFGQDVFRFPSLEVIPYGKISPQSDIAGERIGTLFRIMEKQKGIYLASVRAISEPVIPPSVLKESYLYLLEKEDFSFDELKRLLPRMGYQPVENVEMTGEFALKGGIIDVFSPYHAMPLRIEFFGDTVESMRTFDPHNQRSVGKVSEGFILPARDFIFKEKLIESALENIKEFADSREIPKRVKDEISEKLRNEIFVPGIEFLLPVLYGNRHNAMEYFENSYSCVLYPEEVRRETQTLAGALDKAYDFYKSRNEFAAEPEFVFAIGNANTVTEMARLSFDSFVTEEKTVELDFEDNREITERGNIPAQETEKKEHQHIHPLEHLKGKTAAKRDLYRTLIVCSKKQQCLKIKELLDFYGFNPKGIADNYADFLRKAQKGDIYLAAGRPLSGFKNFSEHLWIITEEEIFGMIQKKKEARKREFSEIISTIYELKEGDLAVHVDCGIGIYRGLKQVNVLGKTGEFIELEYADNGRLFLPVDKINLIQKYIATEDYIAKIDRLGDKRWQKVKKKAKEDLKKWAEEIVNLEAVRRTHEGFAFPVNRPDLDEFSATFDYEETEDQKKAIYEVLEDMASNKPMDRIICGDVGFGKTEVALRAAFIAAEAGKQVGIIVPTTILAEQHYEVFRKRLEPFGYAVGLLSRFVDQKDQKITIEKVGRKEIDVLIGTHRLLSKDVQFNDLGLLIIDEEHKFGVAHKEKLKNIKATMDVLTLTATPIPRTLQMSLSSLKEISLIASPPEGRLSIRTYVAKFAPEIIKEAIEREIHRGGQVFFVHNRIKSIFAMKRYVEELFPYLSIAVAHGRMDEDVLKKVMDEFKEGKHQILLCTAIIESGLDLPNVNTMIVNRADKFGLADLYQLRGRIGRANKRAYSYFLIPSFEIITKDALKRLRALQEMEELGSGFRLAVHDLEIRGAGDLLGKKQSGRINEVGLELYMQLLDETIRELRHEKGGTIERHKVDTEVKLPFPAYIPERYMPSTRERLDFYKKILGARNMDELEDMKAELLDRYGSLPPELENFMYQRQVEIQLSVAGVSKCYLSRDHLVVVFDSEYIPPQGVIFDILKKNRQMKYVPPEKIYIFLTSKGGDVAELKKVLHEFCESVTMKR